MNYSHPPTDSGSVYTGRTTGADGTDTAYHRLGGAGPNILFAHATGLHGRVWGPVAAYLDERAHSIAVDLRGHGETELAAEADIDWRDFGADVVAVARASGSGRLIGVGHSLGGAAMMLAEVIAPGTFDHLLLYEPAVHIGGGAAGDVVGGVQEAMVRAAARRKSRFDSHADALANFAEKPPLSRFDGAVLRAYVEHGLASAPADPTGAVVLKCAPDTEARVYAASFAHDLPDRLADITCPITLVTGAETEPIQRRATAALAEQLGSRVVLLPGGGHFGPMEHPQEFAELIAAEVLTLRS